MNHGTILRAIEKGESEVVLRGLSDADPGTRAFAAHGMAKLEVTDELTSLAKLIVDPNWIVRAAAAGAAGQLGVSDPAIESALISALDDSAPTVVRLSIQALGKLSTTDAVERLIEFVRNGSEALRVEAIPALGFIGDDRAVDTLLPLLEGADMSATIQALGHIGDARAFEPLVARFAAGVNGFDEWYIVAALRDIDDRALVYERMKSHEDPETRRMLGRVASEWWPDEASVAALIAAMSDVAATVRSGAAFRLGNHNLAEHLHDSVKDALRVGLNDDDQDVRHWCEETLAEWE